LSLWMKTKSVTIQLKATEQYIAVMLFISLCKMVLPFEFLNKTLKSGIPMNVFEQDPSVVHWPFYLFQNFFQVREHGRCWEC